MPKRDWTHLYSHNSTISATFSMCIFCMIQSQHCQSSVFLSHADDSLGLLPLLQHASKSLLVSLKQFVHKNKCLQNEHGIQNLVLIHKRSMVSEQTKKKKKREKSLHVFRMKHDQYTESEECAAATRHSRGLASLSKISGF